MMAVLDVFMLCAAIMVELMARAKPLPGHD
jgi:hypothetical protein